MADEDISVEEINMESDDRMEKAVDFLKNEFRTIRTGRASTALLEGIRVECYDTQMPLEQVASMSVPESRLITIQPWDQSIIGDIEKCIELIEQIPPDYDRLAQGLKQLVQDFDFEKLLTLT